jgi:OHCU decarboxylase
VADRNPDPPRRPGPGAPRYPRDLRGHGRHPPDPRWPGGARVAVQIVLNYEEGGENNVLHGDPASEAFLSEISGAEPWPGRRHWNMESIYEYGARAGFWRLHRLLKDLPVTVFGVATALARSPEAVEAMREAGWEIGSHGLRWVEHARMGEAAEAAQIDAAMRLHEAVVGERPRGWYTGRCSMGTLRLAARHGVEWLADSYADDLPYWVEMEGAGRLVVPYTLDANDMRFAVPAGFGAGPEFEAYLRDALDCLLREGGRMLSVGLHCRLAGRPGRAEALRRFLDHARSRDGVWFATRGEIARHWAREHPWGGASEDPIEGSPDAGAPSGGSSVGGGGAGAEARPSRMGRAAFVAAFGDVYEGSPWVAERAHGLELGPAHDSAAGVASALARAFRTATAEERLGVLMAHPDLAGRLDRARRLTPDSAAEQRGAGLDALTDRERARFEDLNARYAERFGHPFIIAVRDHDTASILKAFEARLENPPEVERRTACAQVERIARLRLGDRLG